MESARPSGTEAATAFGKISSRRTERGLLNPRPMDYFMGGEKLNWLRDPMPSPAASVELVSPDPILMLGLKPL